MIYHYSVYPNIRQVFTILSVHCADRAPLVVENAMSFRSEQFNKNGAGRKLEEMQILVVPTVMHSRPH